MDINTALAAAKYPEKTVQICLRGDLRAEFEAAEAELVEMEHQSLVGAPSLADGGRRRELADLVQGLREQMLAESVPFRMRAVSRSAWLKLVALHRKPDEGGLETETFFPAIMRACLVDPVLTAEQWIALEDILTSSQFDALADAAWSVNRGAVDVPFSRAALRITQSSETA